MERRLKAAGMKIQEWRKAQGRRLEKRLMDEEKTQGWRKGSRMERRLKDGKKTQGWREDS